MSRTLTLAARGALGVIASALLVGCGAQTGRTLLTYNTGQAVPSLAHAEEAGHYALYPANSFNPLRSLSLTAGDEYGFRRADGAVEGYARGESIPLTARVATSYYWKFQGKER